MGTRAPQKGAGCSHIDDPELQEQCNSLFKGKHSYRTWDDISFGELYDACERSTEEGSEASRECRVTIRRGIQGVESGRWNDSMNQLHRYVAALDRDEMVLFQENHPRMAKRINGYAKVQQLRTFDELDNGEKLSRQK